MKSVFKKVAIMLIAVMTVGVTANAQEQGDMAIGGNLVLGTGDNLTNYGIGAKFQYNVTTPLRLDGSFTHFFKKNHLSMWDLSVNGHWLFPVEEKITVYPLAGLGITETKVGRFSDNELGINLGGGCDYKLTDNAILNAELKYKVSGDWSRLLLSVGIAYKF